MSTDAHPIDGDLSIIVSDRSSIFFHTNTDLMFHIQKMQLGIDPSANLPAQSAVYSYEFKTDITSDSVKGRLIFVWAITDDIKLTAIESTDFLHCMSLTLDQHFPLNIQSHTDGSRTLDASAELFNHPNDGGVTDYFFHHRCHQFHNLSQKTTHTFDPQDLVTTNVPITLAASHGHAFAVSSAMELAQWLESLKQSTTPPPSSQTPCAIDIPRTSGKVHRSSEIQVSFQPLSNRYSTKQLHSHGQKLHRLLNLAPIYSPKSQKKRCCCCWWWKVNEYRKVSSLISSNITMIVPHLTLRTNLFLNNQPLALSANQLASSITYETITCDDTNPPICPIKHLVQDAPNQPIRGFCSSSSKNCPTHEHHPSLIAIDSDCQVLFYQLDAIFTARENKLKT